MPPESGMPPTSPPPPGDSDGMPPDSPEDADASRRDEPVRASPPGLLLVVSGPSGVGKTTIVRRILERFDGVFSVSATTRPRTAVETDGVDYHFLDEPTFQSWIDADRFLEYAQVFGRSWYGTPRLEIESRLAEGRLVALDIDVQGAMQIRERMPEAYGIFVLPPDDAELLRRLRARGREDEATIERRHAEATREMQVARECGAYDEFVVNDDLDRVVGETIRLVGRRLGSSRT
jgi:guanylate kinase